MATTPFIRSITPRGLLSFGPDTPPLKLGPLNVLIGPNASGKSNLVDVLELVRSLPTDLQDTIRNGGGVKDWLWEGDRQKQDPSLEVVVSYGKTGLQHQIAFKEIGSEFWPALEQIQASPDKVFYEFLLNPYKSNIRNRDNEWIDFDKTENLNSSILAQIKPGVDNVDLYILARIYQRIHIYSTWHFGRDSLFRQSQAIDQPTSDLAEDYSNLAIVLNQMAKSPEAKQHVIEGMRELYENFDTYEIPLSSNSAVEIRFTEGKLRSIPAARLSDGTLRYLCLLTILYNPHPSRVVCVEEPELGLHPDIVAGLAKHLRAASQRMQIIVTTHSDILIDALSDTPECVVVFENHDGATQMNRLDADDLSEWLQKYSLGQLWTKGHIGGNRW